MAAIACDICGGNLSMDASGDFAVCESCGMKHTKDRVKAKAQEITGTVKVSNVTHYADIWEAARSGIVQDVAYFIENGTDVNAQDVGGTPLHYALRYNSNIKVLEYLISKGADVNAKEGYSKETPLHYAAQYNSNVEVLKLLVSHGADLNAKDDSGRTPLHLAVHNPDVKILKYLISKGVDVNAKNKYGETPLDCCAIGDEEKRSILREVMSKQEKIEQEQARIEEQRKAEQAKIEEQRKAEQAKIEEQRREALIAEIEEQQKKARIADAPKAAKKKGNPWIVLLAIGIIGVLLFVFLPKKANTGTSPEDTPDPAQAVETPQPESPLTLGEWKLTGRQRILFFSIMYTADMYIQTYENNTFTGSFGWYEGRRKKWLGTEYFEGTYDEQTRQVHIKGTRLESNSRSLTLDEYEAVLSDDGKNFTNGTWSDGGTWEAEFVQKK